MFSGDGREEVSQPAASQPAASQPANSQQASNYGEGPAAEGVALKIRRARQSLHAGVTIIGYDQFLIIPTRGVRPLPPATKSLQKIIIFRTSNSGPLFSSKICKICEK